MGARGVALAGAMSATPSEESMFWNPAGLAGVGGSRVMLVRSDPLGLTTTAVSVVSERRGTGVLAFTYLLLDGGSQDFTDDDGNTTGTFSVRNHLGMVTAASRLAPGIDVGVGLEFVAQRAGCRGLCVVGNSNASTWALDAGVQLQPRADLPLRFGARVAHLGPSFQYLNAEQADPLPARGAVAVAYDVLHGLVSRRDLQGWVSAELSDRIRQPGSPVLHLGAELAAGGEDAVFLRAGWEGADYDRVGGARVGMGARFQTFEFGIAKSLSTSLAGGTEPAHVTFGLRF